MLAAAALLAGLAGGANAAEIEVGNEFDRSVYYPYPDHGVLAGMHGGPIEHESGPWQHLVSKHIRLRGEIVEGDGDRFAEILDALDDDDPFTSPALTLSSPGGSLGEAIRIADMVRSKSLPTFVLDGDSCLSACALIFLAGHELIMRGLSMPARELGAGGELGFHAPFSALRFGDMPIDTRTMDQVAELFYSAARESIRLVQARVSPWQVSTDFVFEFLGYGPDEFLRMDTAERLFANPMYLTSAELGHPDELTVVDAFRACEFLLFYEFQVAGATYAAPLAARGELALGSLGRGLGLAEHAEDMPSNLRRLLLFYPGQGMVWCQLRLEADGRWRARLAGDHAQASKLAAGVVVNDFIRLGLFVPWDTKRKADALEAIESEVMENMVPAALRGARAPGPDCGSDNSIARRLVCGNEKLAGLEAALGQLWAASDDPAGELREFEALRARACLLSDERAVANRGERHVVHCMALIAAERIGQLSGQYYHGSMRAILTAPPPI